MWPACGANSKAPKARLERPPGWIGVPPPQAGGHLPPGGSRGVKTWSLGVKNSKIQVTPVDQNGHPTDPEHAPNGAKRSFSAAGRWRLAGIGPGMVVVHDMGAQRAGFKSPKGTLKTHPRVIWRRWGAPSHAPPCPMPCNWTALWGNMDNNIIFYRRTMCNNMCAVGQ